VSAGRSTRVIVITGASSGIGLATALAFADQGALLVLAARGEPALQRAAQECLRRGAAGAHPVVADVTEDDAVDAVCAHAVGQFGRVDAWVHTAAVVAYGRFEDIPAHVWRRVVDTNVHGSANVARTALRQFRDQEGGTLVLLGSLLGEIATSFMSPYVTSKWAIRGLGCVLAIETRREAGRSADPGDRSAPGGAAAGDLRDAGGATPPTSVLITWGDRTEAGRRVTIPPPGIAAGSRR